MDWKQTISIDPTILSGKPVMNGTRISVELIVGWLAAGWTHAMILDAYPQLKEEDILSALAFAAEMFAMTIRLQAIRQLRDDRLCSTRAFPD